MPVDVENVKNAFTDFEKENFVDAKEKLTKEIRTAKNDYFKNKLGLQNNIFSFQDGGPAENILNKTDTKIEEPEIEEEPEPEPEPQPKPKKKVRRGLVRNREE